MQIKKHTVTVRELTKNYSDDGDDGVYGLDGKLCLRPAFQRMFVYTDKKRDLVIDTVRNGFPLGLMYWSVSGPDTYECLDGQQRTISIAQYINGDFPVKINGNDRFFHNLTDTEKEEILNYELEIRICDGTEKEKLDWFRVINIAGETLTEQELLNAIYTGPWLADAKTYFSKRNCVAGQFASSFINGNPIRQDYLSKAISWIADRDGLETNDQYMSRHQKDENAKELWEYFQKVINWAKDLFPNLDKKITEVQSWGILYNKYKDKDYDKQEIKDLVSKLLQDDEVTKQAGIIPYVLSERTKKDEKNLSLRTFSEQAKRRAYEKQGHKCPLCQKKGIETEYEFNEMQGDHIIPWSKGGKTIESNLQMLCKECNNNKSDN